MADPRTPPSQGLSGSSILITGGLGFIGSNLAMRLVDEGARVTLVDSLIPQYGGNLRNVAGLEDKLTINIADVRDPFGMAWLVRGHDFIFNLAGQTSHADSMDDPFPDLDINCRAQLTILEACRKHNPTTRIVFASTRQVYGAPQRLPVDESHPLQPVDVNGINKIAGEFYHLLYSKVHGVRTCALRLTNTYGPRMRVKDARQTFLGVWLRRALENKPFQVFGDGTQMRDLLFVDDCVDALVRAATRAEAYGRVFNVGFAEDRTSLLELAKLVVEVAGSGSYEVVPFPPERKKIDIGDYYADSSLIARELGWLPSTRIRDGLARTIEFYRRELPHYIEP